MCEKLKDGYHKFPEKEMLVLEPEDWTPQEWATLCKLSGDLPPDTTDRIVIHVDEIECYIDSTQKKEGFARTVVEWCPHCQSEIEMRWNTDVDGYHAFCPVCGNHLMLCDDCQHTPGYDHCDYSDENGSCQRMKEGRTDEDRSFKLQVCQNVGITTEDIDDILSVAFDAGINYWCSEVEVVGDYLKEYASEQIARGGSLILHDAETPEKWELNLGKFIKGVAMWLANGNSGCIEDGKVDVFQIDAIGADAIIQYALFEEVVFG